MERSEGGWVTFKTNEENQVCRIKNEDCKDLESGKTYYRKIRRLKDVGKH